MPRPASRLTPPARVFALLLGLLLAVHFVLAVAASRHKSTTNDEIAHITSGYAFNALADFRVQPENGVLPQRWHALPLSLSQPNLPDLNSVPWTHGVAYQFSYDFFYRSGNNPDSLLLAGRMMNAVWGMGLIVLVALFTRRLMGDLPAIGVAALATLSPTLLAHSALATSDMAMAFFFVASVSVYWWHLHRPGWKPVLLSGLILGLACVAKFSAVMLLPMLLALAAIRLVWDIDRTGPWPHDANGPRRVLSIASALLVHGLVAWIVIWGFHGFRFAMMSPDVPAGTMPLAWENVLSAHPGWEPLIFGLRDLRLLPEAFLYGFSYVLAFSEARGAFLDGSLGVTGWVSFFPRNFLYKTPTAELVAFGAGLCITGLAVWRKPERWRRGLRISMPLVVLFGVYWMFSLTSNLNIGHRHILPTYPLLWVMSGTVIWWVTRSETTAGAKRLGLLLTGALLGVQLATATRIYPHYLAYFNSVVGGPEKGYRHLVDSSLDWGQDLPGLAAWWHEQQPTDRPLYLGYFGTGEPTAYGIDAQIIARLPTFDIERSWVELEPGFYAISATILQHVYRQKHQPWSAESEAIYQTLRQGESDFFRIDGQPENQPDLLEKATAEEWRHAWSVYDELRFARLCEYLKVRPPDVMIGYSILIFDLEALELERVMRGDLRTLVSAIKAAAEKPIAPQSY